MKKHFVLLAMIALVGYPSFSQEPLEKIMEKRAREMHRVIGLDDKEQWKKFVSGNYASSLIDRPMQEKVSIAEDDNVTSSSTETKPATGVEAKAKMFGRLHDDFGDSKITSIKLTGEKLEMNVEATSGLKATFQLKFQKTSPYLIDGLGIAVIN